MDKVYLVTYGDGSDGDEWYVVSIHRTKESAEQARLAWLAERSYRRANDVEEWELKP